MASSMVPPTKFETVSCHHSHCYFSSRPVRLTIIRFDSALGFSRYVKDYRFMCMVRRRSCLRLGSLIVPRVWIGLWQLSSPAWGTAPASKIRAEMMRHMEHGYTTFGELSRPCGLMISPNLCQQLHYRHGEFSVESAMTHTAQL